MCIYESVTVLTLCDTNTITQCSSRNNIRYTFLTACIRIFNFCVMQAVLLGQLPVWKVVFLFRESKRIFYTRMRADKKTHSGMSYTHILL